MYKKHLLSVAFFVFVATITVSQLSFVLGSVDAASPLTPVTSPITSPLTSPVNPTPTPTNSPTPTPTPILHPSYGLTVAVNPTLDSSRNVQTNWQFSFKDQNASVHYPFSTLVELVATTSGQIAQSWNTTTSASSSAQSFQVADSVPANTYKVRLTILSQLYQASASATPQAVSATTVTVPAPVTPSVTITTTGTISPSQNITFNYTINNPTSTDWGGLFPVGSSDYAYRPIDFWLHSCSLSSYGTPKNAGTCTIQIPSTIPNGNYELRIFRNNSFVKAATSNAITVMGPYVKASNGEVNTGGKITIFFSNVYNPQANDTIEIYPVGAYNASHTYWFYTSSCNQQAPGKVALTQGSCTITLPSNLTDGLYQARLLSKGTYQTTGLSNQFSIISQKVTVTPTLIAKGGKITITYSGILNPGKTDSLEIYQLNAFSLFSTYTVYTTSCASRPNNMIGQRQGSCTTTLPTNLSDGTYVVKLMTAGGTSVSNTFVISTPQVAIQTSLPIITSPSLSLMWANFYNATPYSWIGVYSTGRNGDTLIDYVYLSSCTKTPKPGVIKTYGTCSLTLSPKVASGVYELRMFDGYSTTPVSISSPFIYFKPFTYR